METAILLLLVAALAIQLYALRRNEMNTAEEVTAIQAIETKVDALTTVLGQVKTGIDTLKTSGTVPTEVQTELANLSAKIDAATTAAGIDLTDTTG